MSELNNSDSDTLETNLTELMKKYNCDNFQSDNVLQTQCKYNDFNSSASEDELSNYLSRKEKLSTNNSLYFNPIGNKEITSTDLISDDILCIEDDINPTQNKAKDKLHNANDKLLKKMQREEEKMRKKAERERIKADNLKAKALKQSIMTAYKNLKPEECIKFVTVLIDSHLFSMECGVEIPAILQAASISYKVVAQSLPGTITWVRKTQTQLQVSNEQLRLTNNEDNCTDLILMMMWNEFVQLIYNKELLSNIQIKLNVLPNYKIFLCIYGLENYFTYLKLHRTQSEKQRNTKNSIYKHAPQISRQDVDMALIELQIMLGISHRMLDKPQDVGNIIAQFSKSIAQIPYRQQKQLRNEEVDWFISGDNKDCVRVDKNGNGLLRLWQQQLTQFTLARLETAEAITSKYVSPFSLMKAYDNCVTKAEGEKLLQDIPIRRAAGPLTSVRKIGPELSKKIHMLFTSSDGTVLL